MPPSKSEYQKLMEQVSKEEDNDTELVKQKKAFAKYKNITNKKIAESMTVQSCQLGSSTSLKSSNANSESIDGTIDSSFTASDSVLTPSVQATPKLSAIDKLVSEVTSFLETSKEDEVPKNGKLEKEKIKEQKLKNEILQLKKRKLQAEISKLASGPITSNFSGDSDSSSDEEDD